MKRRDFLSWVGVGWLATSLPVAIAVCLPSPAASLQSQPPIEGEAEPVGNSHAAPIAAGQFVSVGTVAELNAKGFLKRDRPKKLIVIRDPNHAAAVLALTSVCNHLKCTVDWQAKQGEFRCPCHGSRFASDGRLTRGPATKGLTPLAAKIEGGKILVRV